MCSNNINVFHSIGTTMLVVAHLTRVRPCLQYGTGRSRKTGFQTWAKRAKFIDLCSSVQLLHHVSTLDTRCLPNHYRYMVLAYCSSVLEYYVKLYSRLTPNLRWFRRFSDVVMSIPQGVVLKLQYKLFRWMTPNASLKCPFVMSLGCLICDWKKNIFLKGNVGIWHLLRQRIIRNFRIVQSTNLYVTRTSEGNFLSLQVLEGLTAPMV